IHDNRHRTLILAGSMRSTLFVPLALCACNPEPTTTDAAAAQATLTISGVATIRTNAGAPEPAAGASISAARNTVAMPVATTTADAAGAYSLAVTTGGSPIDYIEASLSPGVPVHLYLGSPIASDATANVELLDRATLSAIARDGCNTKLTPTIEVQAPSGVTVSSQPRALRYCTTGGATFLFGVTGSITLSATANNSVQASRTVLARTGTLTVVLLGP
ncbi:MAG TPA: hypothetical protein VLB44_16745, partial [Kofleriaceae bacterium]|nr:hypothetical protein [Kofleriaceae bacterium]